MCLSYCLCFCLLYVLKTDSMLSLDTWGGGGYTCTNGCCIETPYKGVVFDTTKVVPYRPIAFWTPTNYFLYSFGSKIVLSWHTLLHWSHCKINAFCSLCTLQCMRYYSKERKFVKYWNKSYNNAQGWWNISSTQFCRCLLCTNKMFNVKGCASSAQFTAEAIQEVVSGRSKSNQNSRLLNE